MSRAAAARRGMGDSTALRVRAHAKINISLRVTGRRPDGYHELRTVFQSLALHDTILLLERSGPLEVTVTDPAVPSGDDNIVWRAADSMWRRARRRGRPHGLRIHIVKHIPAGGGLGGGSADAAAVLRGLSVLWRLPSDAPSLEPLARELGADVPYFLYGGTALGLDRGDAIFPLPDLPACRVVLALPPFGVSTAAAFGWFDLAAASSVAGGVARVPGGEGASADVRNDLTGAVGARHPVLHDIERLLLRSGASAASMTGTGSTVFGLFRGSAEARRAALRVGAEVPALVSRFVPRREFVRSSRPALVRNLPRRVRFG